MSVSLSFHSETVQVFAWRIEECFSVSMTYEINGLHKVDSGYPSSPFSLTYSAHPCSFSQTNLGNKGENPVICFVLLTTLFYKNNCYTPPAKLLQ